MFNTISMNGFSAAHSIRPPMEYQLHFSLNYIEQ